MSGPAKGKGDLDTFVLRHSSGASAEIYLLGATLCSYKTPDGKEKIFVSPGAIFDGKKAIRGGVPVCFPQFGQPEKSLPQHGFARSSMWSQKGFRDGAEESNVTFTLSDDAASREKWNHQFLLEYTVTLTSVSLTMSLKITNTGSARFDFMALLHTYFCVPDIAETGVVGLAGRTYVDKVNDGKEGSPGDPMVLFPKFTDRVYVAADPGARDVAIVKKNGGETMYAVVNEASIGGTPQPCDVVTWNPYEEASPGDLPPPAYKTFVCVEPGMVNKFYPLEPQKTAELSQKIMSMM
jgi:D-hexose-6-phosphate mutarotase